MATAAWAIENPWRVIYSTRNGMTKAPNLLRNVPRKRIQAGRGSAFRLAMRFRPLVCILGKQKTLLAFRQAGLKIVSVIRYVFSPFLPAQVRFGLALATT